MMIRIIKLTSLHSICFLKVDEIEPVENVDFGPFLGVTKIGGRGGGRKCPFIFLGGHRGMVHLVCFSSIIYNASYSFAASLAADYSSYKIIMSKRNRRDNASYPTQYIYFVSCDDCVKYRICLLSHLSTHSIQCSLVSSRKLLFTPASSISFVSPLRIPPCTLKLRMSAPHH